MFKKQKETRTNKENPRNRKNPEKSHRKHCYALIMGRGPCRPISVRPHANGWCISFDMGAHITVRAAAQNISAFLWKKNV
jgi:hypothetical protein